MNISPEILAKIKSIIKNTHKALIFDLFGRVHLTDQEWLELKEEIKDLEDSPLNPIDISFKFGNLVYADSEQRSSTRELTPAEVSNLHSRSTSLSKESLESIKFAERSVGEFITGLGDRVSKDVTQAILAEAQAYRASVKEGVAEAILQGKSARSLKSIIGRKTGDWERDLDRLASTELHNARQTGIASEINNNFGEDALVAFITSPNACAECRRLHIGQDGAPKIYRLSDVHPAGSNVGRKRGEWLPVQGAVHPNCQCEMIYIPEGYRFTSSGSLRADGTLGEIVASSPIESLNKAGEVSMTSDALDSNSTGSGSFISKKKDSHGRNINTDFKEAHKFYIESGDRIGKKVIVNKEVYAPLSAHTTPLRDLKEIPEYGKELDALQHIDAEKKKKTMERIYVMHGYNLNRDVGIPFDHRKLESKNDE